MNSTVSSVISLCVGVAFATGSFVWLASMPLLSVMVGLFWGLLTRLAFHSRASKWQSINDVTEKSSILGGAFVGLAMFASFSIGKALNLTEDVGLLIGLLVLGAVFFSFYLGIVLESIRTDEVSDSELTSSESSIQSD